MSNTIEVKMPTVVYSAKELQAMPLQEMLEKLNSQEHQHMKNQTIGHAAGCILKCVQNGDEITFKDIGKNKRHYFVADIKIEKKHLKQLERRGFLTIPTVSE